jgi:twitching motility two-component system response regulator PilH
MPVKKVLIVDDSPTERFFMTEILQSQGYEVITADNGADGIATAEALQPDLILMDVVMPDLNGFQATRNLSRNDKTKHIPVIMCTTKNQETDKIWGLRQGAMDYLVKPLDPEELLLKVQAIP